MDAAGILLLFGAGCAAGFLAGFFGVGGGIILVPILLLYFKSTGVSSLVATHLALGTSLFIVIFVSLTSAYQYSQNKHVVWRAVFFLAPASVLGAFVGTSIAAELQGKTLQQIFSVVVIFAALRLLVESGKPKGEPSLTLNVLPLLLIGFVVGVGSALAGVGGGIFSIPMMYSLLKFPLKKALGTSSATIVITALAGTAGYLLRGMGNPLLPEHTLGFVDYLHSLPIIVGSLPFAALGATVAHKTRVDLLRKVFAVFLIVIAIRMFFF
jgi:uncharacterized membrane protein YfcA